MASPFPNLEELLPHRESMLLLYAVLSHEPMATVCAARFDPVFAGHCGGEVSAVFGLELIAQAAAVHHGLRLRTSGQEQPPATRGLLLGSRRLRLGGQSLPTGQTLRVTIFDEGREPGAGGMIRFEGQVENTAGQVLVAGDATVLEMRPEPPTVQLA